MILLQQNRSMKPFILKIQSILFFYFVGLVNSSLKCNSSIPKYRKPGDLNFAKYGLWPGLVNKWEQDSGDTVFGLEEVVPSRYVHISYSML